MAVTSKPSFGMTWRRHVSKRSNLQEDWEKFKKTYGSCICHDIQHRIFGKSCDLWDPKQYEQFEKDGGHGANGCPTVVENAVKWVAELFLEEE